MTVNQLDQSYNESVVTALSPAQADEIIDKYLSEEKDAVYGKVTEILFSPDTAVSSYKEEIAPDDRYKKNYLFCRFHHLFEYEATYYSYLIAKLASRKLFSSQPNGLSRGSSELSKKELGNIFANGAEKHFDLFKI